MIDVTDSAEVAVYGGNTLGIKPPANLAFATPQQLAHLAGAARERGEVETGAGRRLGRPGG